MTEQERPIGEDDLNAFVDGRLPPARRDAVESWLAQHPETAARVADYIAQRDRLRESFAAKHAEPIPARLRVAEIMAGRRFGWRDRLGRLASVLALLVAGGAAGWFGHGWYAAGPGAAAQSSALLAGEAIAAYRTYVVEKLHPVEVDASQEAHLVQWLSRRLGRTLKAPDLTPVGYRLMGGRLLPAGETHAAQFMYEDNAGQRLTLYLRPGNNRETSFRFVEQGGIGAFYWIEDGFAFAVSARAERAHLLKAAQSIYEQGCVK
ncbi:MAG: anti-sigma factor [Alphaproteobacteria bacterium]|nr:anti-sigma factor [Alphaproteobacteria bacterium]